MAAPLARLYQTRTVAALAAELISRAQESMLLGSIVVEERLKISALPHSDTGQMRNSVTVDPIGGFRGIGATEVGMIAVARAPHAEWVDKGTSGPILPTSAQVLPVGKRAPNRKNTPAGFRGFITFAASVSGQPATHWFSRPGGVPLNEVMRNAYRNVWRRLSR